MLTHEEFIREIKKQVKRAGTQKALALKWKVSEQLLSDVLKGKTMPGEKILEAMGYKEVHCYVQVRRPKQKEEEPIKDPTVTNTIIHFAPTILNSKPEDATEDPVYRELRRREESKNI